MNKQELIATLENKLKECQEQKLQIQHVCANNRDYQSPASDPILYRLWYYGAGSDISLMQVNLNMIREDSYVGSIDVIVEDFNRAYERFKLSGEPFMPNKTTA